MAVPPFKVKAVYDYTSEHDDDLNFPIGQVINVIELEGDDWYVGEYVDESGEKKEGIFPSNFVEKYEPEIPARPTRAARSRPEAVQAPDTKEQQAGNTLLDAREEMNYAEKTASPPTIPAVAAGSESRDATPALTIPSQPPLDRAEPPLAPKPTPVEPAISSAKVAPPPVAPKSNAFKDRIAAFNKVEAAPIKPMQPGRQVPAGGFIKKPFVAPPPSSTYVPPVIKQEPVHKPYVREEDPEIKLRQEQDRAAAEAAGLTSDGPVIQTEAEEEAPKPMSLKERMAMLQEQQRLQAERNMETAQRKDRNPPVPSKKLSQSSDQGIEAEDDRAADVRSDDVRERASLDVPRERPRVPSASRQPMSPDTSIPQHEILSGGEEADQSAGGETTEDDDAETIGPADREGVAPVLPRAPTAPKQEPDVGDQDDTAEDVEEEEEEEDEVLDEEELRKQRLRERMARLAGPQGGAAPFNPFGAPPVSQPKRKPTREKPEDMPLSSSPPPNRVPIMPMPGMQQLQNTEQDPQVEQDERAAPIAPPRRSMTSERGPAPPVPEGRPVPAPPPVTRNVPPPPPSDSQVGSPPRPPPQVRSVPPPPQPAGTGPMSPGPGSESDDEMSIHAREPSGDIRSGPTVLPVRTPSLPQENPHLQSSTFETKRTSTGYFADANSTNTDKRASRVPPPVPGAAGPMSSRPPPPPPPTVVASAKQSLDHRTPAVEEHERGESDYEGDYDTDIASGVKHKDALTAHARDSSLDDSTAPEDTPEGTPVLSPRAPPPPAPHGVLRQSMDAPRIPPPMPPSSSVVGPGDDEYDPYSYVAPAGAASVQSPNAVALPASNIPSRPLLQDDADDSSADDVPAQRTTDRALPPPPHAAPQDRPAPPPPSHQGTSQPETVVSGRSSMNLLRAPTGRASMDQARSSFDGQGQIAADVDLSERTSWWTANQPLPPDLQARNGADILTESEESTSSKRGGRTTVTKDIYVLFMDYSQTHITATYDAHDPSTVKLEQEHEPPAPRLRQDQLEGYWQRFGIKIAEAAKLAASSKKDTIVGDGSPYSLPYELIRGQSDALLPVGTRAFGALVYANLANASTMQFDEIRPGDIITVRNARFEGHHGAMRQKYKQDYGPSHVAVVEEWDGTKRAVRAFEQGREKKGGVRSEKFRLGDLRSGEVRVWRVVGRDWVNWQSAS